MLEQLGLTDWVVAIGDSQPWPKTMRNLPSIGRFDSPNAERLIELRVDWLITTASQAGDERLRYLEGLGLQVLELKTDTFDGIFESVEQLGKTFDRPGEAERLNTRMRSDLDRVARETRDLPRPLTLIVVGREPLFVAAPGSHLDEVLNIAGGRNVVHEPGPPYRQYSLEEALARKPEVILDMTGDLDGWGRYDFLPAVRDKRIYAIDPALMAIPGVRLAEMAHHLANRIHPTVGVEDGS